MCSISTGHSISQARKKTDLTGNKSTYRPHLLAGTDLGTGNAVVGICWHRRDLQDVRHRQKGICVMTTLSKKIVNLQPSSWDKVRASDSHHESKELLVLSKGWPRNVNTDLCWVGLSPLPGAGRVVWSWDLPVLLRRCSSVQTALWSLFRDPTRVNSNNQELTQRVWVHAPGRMLKDGAEKA